MSRRTTGPVKSGADRGAQTVAPRKNDPGRPRGTSDSALALQRTAGNRAVSALVSGAVHGGSGHPLPGPVLEEMEGRFGERFGDVRVHAHAAAADSAAALSANAYTVGNHIVFGDRRFAPDGSGEKRLLAHELAHVIQQRRGGSAPTLDPGGALEQHADAAATGVVQGSAPVAVAGASSVGVARDAKDKPSPFRLDRLYTAALASPWVPAKAKEALREANTTADFLLHHQDPSGKLREAAKDAVANVVGEQTLQTAQQLLEPPAPTAAPVAQTKPPSVSSPRPAGLPRDAGGQKNKPSTAIATPLNPGLTNDEISQAWNASKSKTDFMIRLAGPVDEQAFDNFLRFRGWEYPSAPPDDQALVSRVLTRDEEDEEWDQRVARDKAEYRKEHPNIYDRNVVGDMQILAKAVDPIGAGAVGPSVYGVLKVAGASEETAEGYAFKAEVAFSALSILAGARKGSGNPEVPSRPPTVPSFLPPRPASAVNPFVVIGEPAPVRPPGGEIFIDLGVSPNTREVTPIAEGHRIRARRAAQAAAVPEEADVKLASGDRPRASSGAGKGSGRRSEFGGIDELDVPAARHTESSGKGETNLPPEKPPLVGVEPIEADTGAYEEAEDAAQAARAQAARLAAIARKPSDTTLGQSPATPDYGKKPEIPLSGPLPAPKKIPMGGDKAAIIRAAADFEQFVHEPFQRAYPGGTREQLTILEGTVTKYATEGASRLDTVVDPLKLSIDAKKYGRLAEQGKRSKLIYDVVEQAKDRAIRRNLPKGYSQAVVIDGRGQKLTDAHLTELIDRIAAESNGTIPRDRIWIVLDK